MLSNHTAIIILLVYSFSVLITIFMSNESKTNRNQILLIDIAWKIYYIDTWKLYAYNDLLIIDFLQKMESVYQPS